MTIVLILLMARIKYLNILSFKMAINEITKFEYC